MHMILGGTQNYICCVQRRHNLQQTAVLAKAYSPKSAVPSVRGRRSDPLLFNVNRICAWTHSSCTMCDCCVFAVDDPDVTLKRNPLYKGRVTPATYATSWQTSNLVQVVKNTGARVKRTLGQACPLECWDMCATAKGSRAFW